MENFNINAFLEVAAQKNLIVESMEPVHKSTVLYIDFEDHNLSHIKVPLRYNKNSDNCINVYHGESTKNGYWWTGVLDYEDLVDELLTYCA